MLDGGKTQLRSRPVHGLSCIEQGSSICLARTHLEFQSLQERDASFTLHVLDIHSPSALSGRDERP